jgi:glycosyltransferase involved in cell wall biosynthesis
VVKPKLLLVHNYYQEPGGESSVFDFQVRGLRDHGHEVVLYTRTNEDISGLTTLGKVSAVASSYTSRRTRDDLVRLVEQERPAAAIVQNVFPLISPSAYGALRSCGVPVIQAVYNYRLICPAGELYSLGEICERCVGGNHASAVVRRCYRGSRAASAWYASLIGVHRALGTFADNIDAFMVPDDFMARKLVEGGLPAHKMWRNANPFMLRDHTPSGRHDGYVLYVGRLVRPKGVLTAIEAMGLVTSPTRLVVVGRGELEDEVRARTTDRVSFVGARWGDELDALMDRALAIVVPSEWYDNLPQVLCQANAMGKPVISSRINGIPEYVVEGTSGALFEPGDRAALARAIDQLAALSEEHYATLCQTSRRHAGQLFDYEVHYARLMTLIGTLTG